MAAIDVGFLLAVVAFGWGLSLATYRGPGPVAAAGRWAHWQTDRPGLPMGSAHRPS